jgi:ligand-binding sensor domain-containing protein
LARSPDGGLWIGTRKGVWHWNGSVHQHYTQWMASRKR